MKRRYIYRHHKHLQRRKTLIKKALKKIDKQKLIKNIVADSKLSEGSINTAFSRGQISKDLAPLMEKFTSISALFWLMPKSYNMDGSVK